MKKPTILKIALFALIFLQSIISYSQNLVSYSPKYDNEVKADMFMMGGFPLSQKFLALSNSTVNAKSAVAPLTNPVIKYAKAPYLGTVSICPNDGNELPKLFLCGKTETREIVTGLVNPKSIIWERFKPGGACPVMANGDCANEKSSPSCWEQVANTIDYVADTAGQFRIRIVDNGGTPYIFYFNVYQNSLDASAVAKNNIVKYGTSCQSDGKITVKGFGNGYEYSLTKDTSPVDWQDSNVLKVTKDGTYNVFIRLKGIAGSCDFKVPNIVIATENFIVKNVINSPKCNGETGNIKVITNDVGLKYLYRLLKGTKVVGTYGPTADPEYTFSDLSSGTYTVETSVEGLTCMKDVKTAIIDNAPGLLTATLNVTKPTTCSTGTIKVTPKGGANPYIYSVSINDGPFVSNPNNSIIIVNGGKYTVRIVDVNGCSIDKTEQVSSVTKPEYAIKSVDGDCNGGKGSITINVTNSNSYTVEYSFNGNNYSTVNTLTNLDSGNYDVIVRYRKSGVNNNNYCYDPKEIITIGASTALSASAGVAKLSGCGLPGKEIQGLVRITNPVGGIAPYKYSFKGGAAGTFINENELYVNPGKYSLVIMDSKGCTFKMPEITLGEKPTDPTIDKVESVFNCDGSATSTVTVKGGSPGVNYSYIYSIDGKLNTPPESNVFLNVDKGRHTITVEYKVLTVPSYSNLLNEDFGSGESTTSPGINTFYYCFERQLVGQNATYCNGDWHMNDGDYAVTSALNPDHVNWSWKLPKDHTSNGVDPKGRFLVVNIGNTIPVTTILYEKRINDIIPNQPIMFDFYAMNLMKIGAGKADPDLRIALVDDNGDEISWFATGKIDRTASNTEWVHYPKSVITLDPGNNKSLRFIVRSNVRDTNGNDVVIDDIKVFQVPEVCGSIIDYEVVIDGSKAFSADVTPANSVTCFGSKDGGFTITAQNFNPTRGFDYSLTGENGPWINSKVGTVTRNDLGAAVYDIWVRYDETANSCRRPFTREVKAPEVLTVRAEVLKNATCKQKAIIRASAEGGTPAYQFELWNADATTKLRPKQTDTDFIDVDLGTYTIKAYDKNSCSNKVNAVVTVTSPPAIDATIATGSNICYTPANKGSFVVNVTGGVGPFNYSLNGQASISDPARSYSFKDLEPGSYTVTVTDINDCDVTTQAVVIEPELTVLAKVTKTLSCAIPPASSKATITGEINGGKGPYSVTVFSGPDAGSITVTGNVFTFTSGVAGLYTFEITDSKSCKTKIQVTIDAISNPIAWAEPHDPLCNGASTGSVVLSGTQGSGGYKYNFNGGGFSSTALYKNLKAGIPYKYQVQDNNGCISAEKTFTLTEPILVEGSISATVIGCNGTNTVPAVVTVVGSKGSGAPYTYSFVNNTSYSNVNTYSTSVAGTVKAYVKDKNGCEIGPLSVVIAPQALLTGIDIVSDSGLSCPANTADVVIKAVGGVGPYEYKIILPTVSAGNSDGKFLGLTPGPYTFQAVDKYGCNFSIDYTVLSSPAIKVTGTVTSPIKCFGDKGEIQYVVSGTTRFSYNVVNSANVSVANNTDTTVLTINLNNLPTSTYTITVTDKVTKCTATYSLDLTQPVAAIVVGATASKINCKKGKSDITVSVTGGTLNYSYAVAKNTDPVPTVFGPSEVLTVDTNLGVDKNWIVYVKDANGCPGNFSIVIDSEELPTVSAVVNNQCIATGIGNVFTITATGTGLGPLKYSIDGVSFQTNKIFNVPAGTYTVTVEDKNGCRASAPAAIIVSPELKPLALVSKELDCSINPNAKITVNIIGGKGPFQYTVTKGAGIPSAPVTITNGPIILPVTAANAANYSFTITDANNCEKTVIADVKSISNPTVSVKTFKHPSCFGKSDGSVELQATGGSGGGYLYKFNGSVFTSTTFYPNLPAGEYTYEIIDGKGCPSNGTITLTAPTALEVTVDEVKFTCSTVNNKVAGTVTINVTTGTGTGPYEYSFNNGAYTDKNVLTLDDTGFDQPYTYVVRDAKGCNVPGNGILLKLNPPTIKDIQGTPITCLVDKSTVTITKNLNTGVGNLSYEITAPASEIGNVTGATSGEFTGLGVGTYSFKVTDENGCFATGTYKVDNVVKITVSGEKINDVICFNDNNGSIKFTVGNYTTTYSHELKDSLGNLVTTAGETISNGGKTITYTGLSNDLYTFNVTDDKTGCLASSTLKVVRPLALDLTAVGSKVFCNSYNSNITVTPSGGTPNYTYAAVVENGTEPTIYGANPIKVNTVNGTILRWDVYVKDGNNCISKKTIEIDKEDAPTVTATVVQCVAGATLFEVTASGSGVAPLLYSVDGTNFQTNPKFNLVAGTYTITVKDANKCIGISSPIIVNPALTAEAILTKDLTCSTPTAATITVKVAGGKGPYSYTVKIGTGGYGTTFTDITGNEFTYSATTTTGDSYQFLIKDSNTPTGCTIETGVIITNQVVMPTAVTSFENPTCNGYNDGSIKLGATGGLGAYEYSIDNGANFYNTNTFGNLVANTYYYVIRDKKGCEVSGEITLNNPAPIVPVIKINDISCNADDVPGSLEIISIAGGVAPFVYTLYNSSNTVLDKTAPTNTRSYHFPVDLKFGDYYVGIVDSKGCEYLSGKKRISTIPYLKFLPPSIIGGDCITKATVDLFLDPAFSSAPDYIYSIYGDPTSVSLKTSATTYSFTGLNFGQTYVFMVVDNNGCSSMVEVAIPAISLIAFTDVKTTNVTCLTTPITTNGRIDFTVSNYSSGVGQLLLEVLDQLTNLPIAAKTVAVSNPLVENFQNLAAGSYILRVTEVDGTKCSNSMPFEISQPTNVVTSAVTGRVNANCDNPAQVTLTTTGGTGPYTYAVAVAPKTPTDFNTGNNVLELSPGIGKTDLNWNIIVKDSRGCTFALSTIITLDPSPEIRLDATNCANEGAFEITVNEVIAGMGSYKLSVDGGAFFPIISLPYTVKGLNSGKHDIILEDANGCKDTKSIILYKKLTVNPEIKKEIDCTTTPSAVITLNVLDGKGPFRYELSINNDPFSTFSAPFAGPSIDVIASIPGTYEFRVTDDNSCTNLGSIVVEDKVTPDFTSTSTDETCITSDDGTITVTPSAGVGPFTYSINGGGFQTSNEFKNLVAGTYDIMIKDSKECLSSVKKETIDEPLELTALSTITASLNCTTANAPTKAVITITASGGTKPYYYSFNGGTSYSEENKFESYAGIKFDVLVKDANGCKFTLVDGVDIAELTPPTALSFKTTALVTCAQKATVEIIGHTGGTGPNFEYETLAPSPVIVPKQTSTTFPNLTPGDYIFQITDEKGCTYQESYKVENVVNITVIGKTESNVACNEAPAVNNGSVSFTVANFKGAYGYNISPAVPLANISVTKNAGNDVIKVIQLGKGTYTISIVDGVTNCGATASAEVKEPLVPLAITIKSNINGNCTRGSIVTVEATGGTGIYEYAFVSTGGTVVYKSDAIAILDYTKTWIAYVKDANGCTAQIPVPVAQDPLPTINPITGICYTGAPISVTLTGTVAPGSGTPEFNIGNGWTPNPVFELNAPAKYIFSIRDGYGCIAATTYEYELKQELLLEANLLQDLTCGDIAKIDLIVTQGTGTYSPIEFSMDNQPYAVATIPFTTNTPGTYTFRVKDDATCEVVSVPVIVTPLTSPTFTYTKKDISCFGISNGSFVITPAAGVGPYQVSIDGGVLYDIKGKYEFTSLAKGKYVVFIKDSKNCTYSEEINIVEPSQLVVTPVVTPFGCSATNAPVDAVVTLNATFGTTPYSYSFDNGVSFSDIKNSISVSSSKTIKYVVIDKNGCRIPGEVLVPVYNPPTDMNIEYTPIYCNTLSGKSTVTVTSVTGPPVGTAYTYEIISPVGVAPSNNTGVFLDLLPNTYQIKVTDDASKCYKISSVEVKKASEISVVEQSLTDVLCNGDSTGSVSFTISNYITATKYSYTLVPNPLGLVPIPVGDLVTYTGLSKGRYTFTVTDDISGCNDKIVDFLIDEPINPLSFTSTASKINCNKDTALITVTATGGTSDYKYAVVPVGTLAPTVFFDNKVLEVDTNNGTVMSWQVYVVDKNGCPVDGLQEIELDLKPANITVNAFSHCADEVTKKYTFVVTATGVNPLTYSIGGGFNSDGIFVVDNPGKYDVIVKDGNGCETIATALVDILPALNLEYKIVKEPSCDEGDGEIFVKGLGGSSNYTYVLDNNGFLFSGAMHTFKNVSSGDHTIKVTDDVTGCSYVVSFKILRATPVDFNVDSSKKVSCFGASDGKIIVLLKGINDNPVYKYKLDGTTKGSTVIGDVNLPAQDKNFFENLKPGDYTITVISGRGCKKAEFVRIAEPDIIVVSKPVIEDYGCTLLNIADHASVTINTVTGGSGKYTYQFFRDGAEVQNGPLNVYIETDFLGGNYVVKVFDENGCSGTSIDDDVRPFISLDKIIIDKIAITCVKNEDIKVTVKTTGGVPANLVYTITGTGTTVFYEDNNDGNFTNLPVGSYLISVKNIDTGCVIEDSYFVNHPNTFDLVSSNVTNVKCFGSADGSVDLTLVDNIDPNDAGEFKYDIIDVETGSIVKSGDSRVDGTVTISGLLAGTYKVIAKLKGPSECDVETNFTISQPASKLEINPISYLITCNPGNDGKIFVTASGGWPGEYEYALAGPVNHAFSDKFEFTGLTEGTYIVSVRDSKGCIVDKTIKLDEPKPINVTALADANVLTCFGDTNGIIRVTAVTGGEGSNYSYILNNLSVVPTVSTDAQTDPVFMGLSAGKYSVTIVDGINCSATTAEIEITQATEVVPELVLESRVTCLTQATLTLSATGGTGPYEYSTDKTFATIDGVFINSSTFPVAIGNHQYYVRDVNQCVSYISNNVTVNPITPLSLILDLDNALVYCKGEASAAIDATAVGGLGNYIYTLLNGAGVEVRPAQTDGYFDNLPAGSYIVRVNSEDCDYDTPAVITINEPNTKLTVSYQKTDVSCNGGNDGKIVITASGGTGVIKYAISPNLGQFDDKFEFDRLEAGTYTIIVQDEAGCLGDGPLTITIDQPNILGAKVIGPIIQQICEGVADGAFSIEIFGGTPPYSVSLDKENGVYEPVSGTQHDFNNIVGGKHKVYIKDASCLTYLEVIMDNAVKLDPVVVINTDCVSNVAANFVTITVHESNTRLTDVDYSLDGADFQPSNVFPNVAPGKHVVIARHLNGCTEPTAEFTIEDVQPLTLTLADGGLNEIVATATGGGGEYQYTLDGEPYGSVNKFIIYKSGTYTVTVTDKNGCTATATRYFEYIDVCIPNHFTPNGDGINDTWAPGCTVNYKDLTFDIFDRYGRVICKYRLGQKWDGRYNGNELPSGDYWYVLKLNDKKDDREFVGHFTLYR
ncbi:T9SS type B sorting domain-containing protein [Flavobacterium sp. 140616W15]|uniref:T9SS type B sorting domain-containing protein n=1 Tax=Flavobacterium sp. 140616W15 TaxID=2478552 RepID=UPI0013ED87E6|nr:T9SS type B sorting domain-containing protein [Flavobacterium sp. 140616W15]